MITGNSALFPQCSINILTNVCKPKTLIPAVKSSGFSMMYSKQNTEYIPSHHKWSKNNRDFAPVHKLHLQFKQYLCKEQRERWLSSGYILLLKKKNVRHNLLLLWMPSQLNLTQKKPTWWLLRNVSLCYFSGVVKFILTPALIDDLGDIYFDLLHLAFIL